MTFPQATWLGLVGWLHLIVFGLLIPALVVRARRRMTGRKGPLPPRLVYFKGVAGELTMFGALSIGTAYVQRITLFPTGGTHILRGVLSGAVMYACAVAFMLPRWRRAVERRAPAVHFFAAENKTERPWWLVVSVLAGVSEEITWRGVQTALLVPLTGSYAGAALGSALSFGAAHMMQGWKSSAIIVAFGLGFQVVVWASGSLYVAMVVHTAYDVTAGLTYGRLVRELGYDPKTSE
jgi:membrane protease YdiL (CAAX protease family)